jgi:hypothetical protein
MMIIQLQIVEWTIKRQYQLKWWTTWTHHKTGGKIKCSSIIVIHILESSGCRCHRIRMVCCFLGVLEFPALINLDIIDWSISLAQLITYMFSSDLYIFFTLVLWFIFSQFSGRVSFMGEAMPTIPKLCLRAYIVCPVTLHKYSLPKTTRQVKGVNLMLFHKKERPK